MAATGRLLTRIRALSNVRHPVTIRPLRLKSRDLAMYVGMQDGRHVILVREDGVRGAGIVAAIAHEHVHARQREGYPSNDAYWTWYNRHMSEAEHEAKTGSITIMRELGR